MIFYERGDDDLFRKATLLRYPYVDMTVIRKATERGNPRGVSVRKSVLINYLELVI